MSAVAKTGLVGWIAATATIELPGHEPQRVRCGYASTADGVDVRSSDPLLHDCAAQGMEYKYADLRNLSRGEIKLTFALLLSNPITPEHFEHAGLVMVNGRRGLLTLTLDSVSWHARNLFDRGQSQAPRVYWQDADGRVIGCAEVLVHLTMEEMARAFDDESNRARLAALTEAVSRQDPANPRNPLYTLGLQVINNHKLNITQRYEMWLRTGDPAYVSKDNDGSYRDQAYSRDNFDALRPDFRLPWGKGR